MKLLTGTMGNTLQQDIGEKKTEATSNHERIASLSDVEQAVLHALFIDKDEPSPASNERRCFSDEMLFSALPSFSEVSDHINLLSQSKIRPSVTKKQKNYRLHVGLWQAHEAGVSTNHLRRMSSAPGRVEAKDPEDQKIWFADDEEDGSLRLLRGSQSDVSWDETEGSSDLEHFDAWQVLKDEYAQECGFDYQPSSNSDDSDLSHNQFKIIGTSADDKSSHPHVVSPPLLDSIMNFLPKHLHNQNYWMKYSLIRDGASLETFKTYVRGAKDVILAIETTKGDVFGVYTSSPWTTSPSFFGGLPSFVWKMRYNRYSPCHSLIEQATMESEVDAYPLLDLGVNVQTCTHDRLGVGIGNMNRYDCLGNIMESEQDEEKRNGKNFGFAICLEDDFLSGTTSRSTSYRSPCLVDARSNGESFEVLNLEAWTLTPAFTQESAEKLEMTHYFVSESIRSTARSGIQNMSSNDTFSSRDLDQHSFYRRLGHEDSNEELRDRWQLHRMMDRDETGQRGMGASPRYA